MVARNRRVLKAWNELLEKAPENMRECFLRLREKPTERVPGRVFPLKHKNYKGSWEYVVTGGDRVFYTPDSASKRVVVYYAGKHVSPAPESCYANSKFLAALFVLGIGQFIEFFVDQGGICCLT